MTQAPPHEMIVKMMMRNFVLCVVTNAPPEFVGSAMRSIALNVLTLTLVEMKLCMLPHNSVILLYLYDLPMLQYTLYHFLGTQSRQGYGCRITMHDGCSVCPQLCFVVSFVLRVPGLEEGVMFGGKALG